jgi:hypothetical protein
MLAYNTSMKTGLDCSAEEAGWRKQKEAIRTRECSVYGARSLRSSIWWPTVNTRRTDSLQTTINLHHTQTILFVPHRQHNALQLERPLSECCTIIHSAGNKGNTVCIATTRFSRVNNMAVIQDYSQDLKLFKCAAVWRRVDWWSVCLPTTPQF